MSKILRCWTASFDLCERFRADSQGQIAILFALASVVITMGLAAGIDLARAYAARQRLSEVAVLTCQYSTRPSVTQSANGTSGVSNGFQQYITAVNAFASSSLAAKNLSGATTSAPGGSYFTATQASSQTTSAASTGPSNPIVELAANVPTTFLQILNVTQIPVHTKVSCLTQASAPQIVTPPTILKEGFETSCSTYCDTRPDGTVGNLASPVTAFPSAPSYTGSSGTKWYIMGYCLETDILGVINGSDPEGNHSAELDCDNGSNSAGNSSISAKMYLEVGSYELRYNYRSRVDYPNYDPTYLCASTASDLAWANDRNSNSTSIPANALRTNQMNVYLDMNVGSAPPLHTTIDGTEQLAGSNLIDMCVYTPTWVERSVRINVTTPAFYWLSFAADGQNDSFGAQLDNIRFCQATCPGALQDNYPASWLAANNGGAAKVLFEDTFDLPPYTATFSNWLSRSGNMNNSLGTSGSIVGGWPTQAASGWATAPFNQTNMILQGAAQGTQYVTLDGYSPTGSPLLNRLMSRPFLLDPGYYQVSYYYISNVDFSESGVFGTNCSAAPASGLVFPSSFPNYAGHIQFYRAITTNGSTNLVGVFMANGQLVSTPIGGGALNSATSFTNPDGSVSTTPTVPPDAVTWSNYNAGAVNPVIDACSYADSYRWITRSVSVKITKPGLYWLTFSANGGTVDGYGGGVDDVKLTALGSPSMSSPPSTALTTIPVPSPQPNSTYTNNSQFNGFSIVADPFVPPAAYQ